MVKMFGSIASALYEFGADPETGKISRKNFENVLVNQLKLFAAEEANILFSHITDADPSECGLGGVATFKDFSITEDEWRRVVAAKVALERQDKKCKHTPFTSGPSGGSLGIYHRPINLTNVGQRPSPEKSPKTPKEANFDEQAIGEETEEQLPSDAKHTTESRASTTRIKHNKRVRLIGRGGARVWPWQLPQKPWAPCVFAGNDLIKKSTNAAFRFNTDSFSKTFRNSKHADETKQPRHSQLGPPNRPCCQLDEAAGHLLSSCCSARAEMEPAGCARQVAPWWPYERPAPPPRLPAVLPRRPPTGQLRQL